MVSTSSVTKTTSLTLTSTLTSTSTAIEITTTADPYPCPSKKKKAVKPKVIIFIRTRHSTAFQFSFQTIKDNKDIKDWEACAGLCQKSSDCVAWSYRPKNKKPKKTQLCSIYSEFKSFAYDKYTISGSRNCPTLTTTTTSDFTSGESTISSLTTSSNDNVYEKSKQVTIYINDGSESTYKCGISIKLNLERGMKFEVLNVSCQEDKSPELASNSEVGLYKFSMEVETNIEISCQFAGVYKDPNTISEDSIRDSIKCDSHCTTIGGPEADKPCLFPFVWKGMMYGECTDIDHPEGLLSLDLFCATEIDKVTKEMKSWGKCSRTCGYCFGAQV